MLWGNPKEKISYNHQNSPPKTRELRSCWRYWWLVFATSCWHALTWFGTSLTANCRSCAKQCCTKKIQVTNDQRWETLSKLVPKRWESTVLTENGPPNWPNQTPLQSLCWGEKIWKNAVSTEVYSKNGGVEWENILFLRSIASGAAWSFESKYFCQKWGPKIMTCQKPWEDADATCQQDS